jgi:predicted DNA-binding transcriptional regulator YafY
MSPFIGLGARVNRTERMYAIVETLRSAGARGRTTTWLAEHFEVSVRTIKRDMRALQEAGAPVVGQDGRGGGYQLTRSAALPPLTFTGGEATAIAIAIAAEPELPFGRDARAALHKVLAAMSPAQRQEVEALAGRIWMRTPPVGVRTRQAAQLDEALRRSVVARIDYEDGKGQASQRHIEPLAFARTSGYWYALAWCRTRRAGRWFRMDRIRKVSLTREPITPRDLEEVFGSPPGDAHPVRVRSARLR